MILLGDTVRCKKRPDIGGAVQLVQGKYVSVMTGEKVETFLASFLEKAAPIPVCGPLVAITDPNPVPDPWVKDSGVMFWLERFIHAFNETRNRNLYPKGGCLRQFMGYCLFLEWVKGKISNNLQTVL